MLTTTQAIATYATNEPQYATRSLLSRREITSLVTRELVHLAPLRRTRRTTRGGDDVRAELCLRVGEELEPVKCSARLSPPHNLLQKKLLSLFFRPARHHISCHICAIQAFEAFDTFEDIGEISSKGCPGSLLRLLRIWRCGAPLLSLGTPPKSICNKNIDFPARFNTRNPRKYNRFL